MLKFIRSLLSGPAEAAGPRVPEGLRVYAVGDVHGRLDLLEAMIAAVEADVATAEAARGAVRSLVIMLGDLVDRGPASAQVVARVREWQACREVRVLAGNHEEMFLKSFESTDMLRHFLRHGGRQTLASYGLEPRRLSALDIEEVQVLLHQVVPQAERDYLAGFEDLIVLGDYAFVHAGIDPAVPIHEQRTSDMRWIREPFLSWSEPLGHVVVHGHTISEQPEVRGNRIGVDTGAYASGRLTALVLEDATRRFIEVKLDDFDRLEVTSRAA